MPIGLLSRLVLLWLVAFLVPTSIATAEDVDLELVLAVDVSSSVDPYEATLQRVGYVQALVHPDVVEAISLGPFGRIAVIYVEWAGAEFQTVVVDWTLIRDTESARAFAIQLSEQPIGSAPATSISAVIDFARVSIASNAHRSLRQVIDISGDGPSSDGRPVWEARDDAVAEGIIINGLPILSSRPDPQGFSPAVGVTRHYLRHVIGGVGSFALEVNEFENFASALVSKLVREIKGEPSLSLLEGTGNQLRLTSPDGIRSTCRTADGSLLYPGCTQLFRSAPSMSELQ